MVNIYYKGRKIYNELTHEEAADILHELALEKYEENKDIDLDLLDVETIVKDT